jgi:hypothetical protein
VRQPVVVCQGQQGGGGIRQACMHVREGRREDGAQAGYPKPPTHRQTSR